MIPSRFSDTSVKIRLIMFRWVDLIRQWYRSFAMKFCIIWHICMILSTIDLFNQIIDLWHSFEWLCCQISLLPNPNPGELSVLLQSKNTAVIPECQVLSWKWFAGSVNRNISNTHTQLLTRIISRVRYSQFIDNCWHWILQTICGLNLYKWTITLKTFSSQLSKHRENEFEC